MSGSVLGDSIRAAAAAADQTVIFDNEYMVDGTQAGFPASIPASSYVTIDTVAGGSPAADLFVPGNVSYLENVDDSAPIISSSADATQNLLVYQGDAAGQTFYAGGGNIDALFTGYGNTFATASTSGTYVVVAGLQSAQDAQQTLAAAPTTQLGNTIVAASGDASISAGLGYNTIFLGTGSNVVANEGYDSIIGGSGAATVDGAGQSTIFAGTGSTEFDGAGGSTLILGNASDSGTGASGSVITAYGGMGSVSVYGGSGDVTAYGGLAGNNILVSGTGNSTLVGGGSGSELVANGGGTATLVASASGSDTLAAGGSSGAVNIFLGGGFDTVVTGTGTDYVQFGTGSSTVDASAGNDVFGIVNAADGGTNVITGFNASSDFLSLEGFDSSVTASSVLATDVTYSGGSTFLTIPQSGFSVELYDTASITSANFT